MKIFQKLSVLLLLSQSAFAQTGAPALPGGAAPTEGAAAAPANPVMQFVPMLLFFAVLYFLVILPQRRQKKQLETMLSTLTEGDEVVTTSGFIGKFAGAAGVGKEEKSDKVVWLELSNNVKVRVLKSQIAQVVKGSVQELNTV